MALTPHTEYIDLPGYRRKDLAVGDEVIISSSYGSRFTRRTVTKRTETQLTVENGDRYSIKSGRKIGSGESYSAPHIIGTPKHTTEEAQRLAVEEAAREEARQQALGRILDELEAHSLEHNISVPKLLNELGTLLEKRRG